MTMQSEFLEHLLAEIYRIHMIAHDAHSSVNPDQAIFGDISDALVDLFFDNRAVCTTPAIAKILSSKNSLQIADNARRKALRDFQV
jgi:hypothetical protein